MFKEKYGFINKAGEWVVEPQFNAAEDFYDGLAMVELGTTCCYIDKLGNYIYRGE